MWKKVSFKKVISVVKLSLFITWCWPLPRDAIKLKVIGAALYQYFCIIVVSSVALGLMNTVRNHLDDPLIMAKSISVLFPALQAVFNIMCFRVYSTRIQVNYTFNVFFLNKRNVYTLKKKQFCYYMVSKKNLLRLNGLFRQQNILLTKQNIQ